MHNARWNSRAIFALIAYFLLPTWRDCLEVSASFIANEWQKAWFSNQKYNPETYGSLLKAVTLLNVSKFTYSVTIQLTKLLNLKTKICSINFSLVCTG